MGLCYRFAVKHLDSGRVLYRHGRSVDHVVAMLNLGDCYGEDYEIKVASGLREVKFAKVALWRFQSDVEAISGSDGGGSGSGVCDDGMEDW